MHVHGNLVARRESVPAPNLFFAAIRFTGPAAAQTVATKRFRRGRRRYLVAGAARPRKASAASLTARPIRTSPASAYTVPV